MQISMTFLVLSAIMCMSTFLCCREVSSKQKISHCNANKIHVPYETHYGKYVMFADQYNSTDKYKLTLSIVSNDSSYMPLFQFVKNATNEDMRHQNVIVFYTVDTNVVHFLNDKCIDAKAFMIYERKGTLWATRFFKQNEKGTFIEDLPSKQIVSKVEFKLIVAKLRDIQKTHPEVIAYHFFSAPN